LVVYLVQSSSCDFLHNGVLWAGPPAAAAAVAARAKTLTVEKKLQTDLCSLLACVVEHLFKSIHMVNDAIVVFYFIQLQNPNLGRPTSSKCYKFCLLSGSNLI
jgi:hypothetical protein